MKFGGALAVYGFCLGRRRSEPKVPRSERCFSAKGLEALCRCLVWLGVCFRFLALGQATHLFIRVFLISNAFCKKYLRYRRSPNVSVGVGCVDRVRGLRAAVTRAGGV